MKGVGKQFLEVETGMSETCGSLPQLKILRFLWQKTSHPPLTCRSNANNAMEGRSRDNFTRFYKWLNATDAKFLSPISFDRIVFSGFGILRYCGHLAPVHI